MLFCESMRRLHTRFNQLQLNLIQCDYLPLSTHSVCICWTWYVIVLRSTIHQLSPLSSQLNSITNVPIDRQFTDIVFNNFLSVYSWNEERLLISYSIIVDPPAKVEDEWYSHNYVQMNYELLYPIQSSIWPLFIMHSIEQFIKELPLF